MAFLEGDTGVPWFSLLTAMLFALEAVDVETEAPAGDCEMRGDTAIFGALSSFLVGRNEEKEKEKKNRSS